MPTPFSWYIDFIYECLLKPRQTRVQESLKKQNASKKEAENQSPGLISTLQQKLQSNYLADNSGKFIKIK